MQEPKVIELPKFLDERGNLSFFENDNQLPFAIQRVHWIYDVPGGEERGGKIITAAMDIWNMSKIL